MKTLLIDIGNTTADFRIWDSKLKILEKIIRPETKDMEWRRSKILSKYFTENNIEFDQIAYVSVVPEWNDILRAFAINMKTNIFNLRSDFKIDKELFEIDDINKLGADFISNFYGALAKYDIKSGVVISMGTASTLAIVENSKFKGAIICPGLKSSLNCLISSAVLLQNNTYEKSNKTYGKNTVDAINFGAYNAHYLMLSSIIRELKFDFAIFTGGNSVFFKEEIQKDNFIFDEQLIFEGLIRFIK
ncbi:type III pantothenate kinase [Spiroplasma diminutum]|uniref:Type III pantothenate kinase n=1 Tax=Spiroplasma diminutum CUAS-1 TaxID=1276221 RepID=S5MF71_9MOLU|nr:type III pantothenate kinase [Spiroplasma diminutum]AGR42443.1 putative transcriptional regulator [Spiroplasma diminutum CUAS-1]